MLRFIWAVIRYLITHDCGYACGWKAFYTCDTGEMKRLWVPERGCPLHDWHEWIG